MQAGAVARVRIASQFPLNTVMDKFVSSYNSNRIHNGVGFDREPEVCNPFTPLCSYYKGHVFKLEILQVSLVRPLLFESYL